MNVLNVGTLTVGGEVGVKYRKTQFKNVDYDFNVELLNFEADL